MLAQSVLLLIKRAEHYVERDQRDDVEWNSKYMIGWPEKGRRSVKSN